MLGEAEGFVNKGGLEIGALGCGLGFSGRNGRAALVTCGATLAFLFIELRNEATTDLGSFEGNGNTCYPINPIWANNDLNPASAGSRICVVSPA